MSAPSPILAGEVATAEGFGRRHFRCGLDRLLEDPSALAGRHYGLLCHQASVTGDCRPAHLALQRSGVPPSALFGPEHGFYGVEQDMAVSTGQVDPWTGIAIHSLYGENEDSLRPDRDAFRDLDLLVIDLQDVGARYYTFAATAVWAAEVALAAGCEVWLLDRPNPLGGDRIEGNLPQSGFESFVGAFRLPVRHGLTLGELMLLESRRRGWDRASLRVVELDGWRRSDRWRDLGRPWIAPSPNMPTLETVALYPGACLIEATDLSEGRGTTRPFQLVGAPWADPVAAADRLTARDLPGLTFLPVYFRPQFQKHAGEVCGGVEVVILEPERIAPYRLGIELLVAFHGLDPERFSWRSEPYEFVVDRPAIDLLTGSRALRQALGDRAAVDDWLAAWSEDEASFAEERAAVLLYQ